MGPLPWKVLHHILKSCVNAQVHSKSEGLYGVNNPLSTDCVLIRAFVLIRWNRVFFKTEYIFRL